MNQAGKDNSGILLFIIVALLAILVIRSIATVQTIETNASGQTTLSRSFGISLPKFGKKEDKTDPKTEIDQATGLPKK